MNLKHFFIGLIISCNTGFFSAKAAIIQCKNTAGKLVFTDNINNCADKNSTKHLVTTTESGHFYNEIPDLTQTLASAGFAGDGQQFCAPVSISNSIVWLEGNKEEKYQIDLVKKLASTSYMNTNTNGTNVHGVTQGVHKYAIERWGGYKTLEYSGWSKAPAKFRSNLEKPTLHWMTQALHKKGAVWLNIGWYNLEGENYKRVGGHWVTLVGYEQGKIVIHDPAPRAGTAFSNQFVSLRILNSGQLISGQRIGNARNHFIITDGMFISSKGRLAIIDGAVKFELN
ncbi:MAG TPA: C39 family peptidase [Cellvibrio sp.]|nr:C39 family peptidase [Cellvibrio sp.]